MSRVAVFIAETLRMAAPYAACGLAAVITERAGVVNVALEGALVTSALASAVGAIATGSAVGGLLSGVVAGAAFCLLHGFFVVRGRVSAIVSGIALNIIAVGLSRVVLRLLYDSASNSPRIPGFPRPSGAFLAVVADPVWILVALSTLAVPWLLLRTRFGLRLRAVGENPDAARAAGVDAGRVRLAASALSGALAGLGGAHLVFDQRHFDAGMSGGRGFIALAAVILGGWRPGLVVCACLGFAALEATQIAAQDVLRVPSELVQMLPYLATLVLLGVVAGRSRAPAGIGRSLSALVLTSPKRRDDATLGLS